jgi:hypothetical protein
MRRKRAGPNYRSGASRLPRSSCGHLRTDALSATPTGRRGRYRASARGPSQRERARGDRCLPHRDLPPGTTASERSPEGRRRDRCRTPRSQRERPAEHPQAAGPSTTRAASYVAENDACSTRAPYDRPANSQTHEQQQLSSVCSRVFGTIENCLNPGSRRLLVSRWKPKSASIGS